jgi:HPt (histidine-containing phosphotransfer) domain-containing protein
MPAIAIDRSTLDELTGGDEELNRDILSRYLQSLGDDLEALRQALRDGDVADLRRHAHRIAGASRTVGAHAVAAEASQLELAAQGAQDSAELERLTEALRETGRAVSPGRDLGNLTAGRVCASTVLRRW